MEPIFYTDSDILVSILITNDYITINIKISMFQNINVF